MQNILASLDLGYRFSLDHFTIHQEETVLFAVVSAPSCALLTRADRLIE